MACREVPDPPPPGPHEVLLRLAAVGVCGSDVHYYTTGRIGSQVVAYPFAVGHECAAIVERVGSAARRVRTGQLVAVEPAVSCGACDQCRAGRRHTCRTLRFLGCPGQMPGCLCEWLVMPEECCFPVPDGMSAELATLVEPLSIGLYAVQLAALKPGQPHVAAILGCGPIGLSVLHGLRAAHPDARVYMTDKLDGRLDHARRAGAAWTGNPEGGDVVAAMSDVEPMAFDVVFECCGQQDAMDQGVKLLKPGGSLMLVGIPQTDRVSFSIDLMRRKELRLQNVRRQNECMQHAVDLAAARPSEIGAMVTHRYGFAETSAAFDLVADYEDNVVKAVIAF